MDRLHPAGSHVPRRCWRDLGIEAKVMDLGIKIAFAIFIVLLILVFLFVDEGDVE